MQPVPPQQREEWTVGYFAACDLLQTPGGHEHGKLASVQSAVKSYNYKA